MTALNIWHPFTQEHIDPPPERIVSASGAYLYTEDGRRIIDAISSWWVNLHGHCHPHIVQALTRQAVSVDHVLLAGATHYAVEELTTKLRKILPANLEHVFYSDDGSTAVEVALKIAVQYWHNRGLSRKNRIVALDHAYHGDTCGAMSVSADSVFTAAFERLRFPVRRVYSAYCYRCPAGKSRSSCSIDCAASLEMLLRNEAESIAAVIVEPLLQGAGGMIVHPVEFLQRIAELCREHNVLLIADEVLTGFGRCGKMFACELAKVEPDLMCLSKGITGGVLPLGATACSSSIRREFSGEGKAFFHGHSYTGNPLACAAGIASLEIFETEDVFSRIQGIAQQHETRLEQLRNLPSVGDVRQIGTVAAIELDAPDPGYLSRQRPLLYRFFLERGVLLRPLGNVIYVLPPYVISAADLDHIYDVIEEALRVFGTQLSS
jgi:adenosylmethionine---8-amino-7-oxononanoate aminotransferase